MKLNLISFITIILLLVVILLQDKCSSPTPTKETRDTIIVYKTVHDTIPGKIQFVKTKIDTSIWQKKSDYKPDTTYKGLLKQYNFLGNKHFATNSFKTDFAIGDYGTVSVIDSVRENWLVSSVIETNLKIPTTTITVTKEAPIKRQLYVGFSLTGNQPAPINGVYGDIMLKTKKDRLYGVSMGFNGEPVYKVSLLWPLKIK